MNGLVLSLYIGYALYIVFPFKNALLAMGGTDAMRTIIAIVLYVVAVGFSHYLLRSLGMHARGRSGLPAVVLGVLVVAFLLALCYQLFNITQLIILPPLVVEVFGPSMYFFWWFIAPIVGLFFLG